MATISELSDIIEGPVEPQMLDEAARAVVTDKPVVDKIGKHYLYITYCGILFV